MVILVIDIDFGAQLIPSFFQAKLGFRHPTAQDGIRLFLRQAQDQHVMSCIDQTHSVLHKFTLNVQIDLLHRTMIKEKLSKFLS